MELTRDAERDLIEIYHYSLRQFGQKQADKYLEELSDRIDFVSENPSFGADYEFVRSGLRRYEAVSHAIYYLPLEDGIQVMRILHGRMDPGRHIGR